MKKLQYILYFIGFFIFAVTMVRGNADKDKNIRSNNLTDIVPCKLLTSEQVTTVLPGHDDGFTANAGGSLMEGVDSYQCSYTNDKYDLFTVIVHVATNQEQFDWIKPKKSISEMYEDAVKLSVGDGGWLYGEQDDMKLKASIGYTVIELELMSQNAGEKGDAMVGLAKILISKLK